MRKKISNFTFEKFVFFVFFVALALISAKSAAAQIIVSDSGNILEIKASSTPTKSILKFLPSTSVNSFSLQAVANPAVGASTISIFDYLSSTSLFKMLNGVFNFNPNNNYIGIGTTNPQARLNVVGKILAGSLASSNGYNGGISLYNNSNEETSLFLWQNGIASGKIGFAANNNNLRIVNTYTDGSISNPAAIDISTTGNVGIGTTSPSAKLSVSGGNIFITDAVINSGTPHAAITKTYLDSALGAINGYQFFHSGSDFANGTLVSTNIPASASEGNSFVIEISGKSYSSSNPPFKVIAQGYLYGGTIISYSGVSYGGEFAPYIKMFEDGGYLKFWWPRISYWNSFNVHVRNADGNAINRVTSISDSTEPTGTKKIQVNLHRTWNSYNSNLLTVDWKASRVGVGVSPAYKLDVAYDGSGVNLTGNTIHNLGEPVTGTDAVNRNYVDSNFAPIGGGASLWATSSAGIYNVGLGNVGIGTTNPLSKLDVNGGINTTGINHSNGSIYLGGNLHIDSKNGNDIYLNYYSAQNTRIYAGSGLPIAIFNTAGNVGIGNNAPAQKLDVTGSINSSAGYKVNNSAVSGNYLRGNGSNFVASTIQAGDVPTLNQNTSGYAGYLMYEDNRSISPSELARNMMKFGFTSYENNNSAPWADFLHFRSYGDSSAGNDNLLVFNKTALGMRLYQEVFGSASPNTKYKDVVLAENTPATNYLTKYASTGNSVTVSSSQVYDNGTRVGVGTTAPSHKLHVVGEGNFNNSQVHGVSSPTVATDVANKGYVDSAVSGGGGTSYWSANGDDIYNNNINFVGIGNQIPIARLHVGDRNFDWFDSNTDGPKDAEIISRGNMIVGAVDFESSGYIGVVGLKKSERSGAGFTGMKADVNGGDDNIETNLNFLTSKGSDSRARMIIDYNGDVGIGVGAPSAKLDVAGSGKFVSGTAAVPGVMIGAVNSGIFSPSAGQIAITTSGRNTATFVSSSATDVRFQINTTNYSTMFGQYEGNWYGVTNPLIIQPLAPATAHDIAITGVQNSPLSGIVIKSNGRIGIGVAAPNYKLDVLGEANFYGNQIHNVGIPTAGTDAVNKNYVDSVSSGSNWTANGNNIYNSNTGNVGLGTSAPGQQLEITKNFKLPTSTGVTAGVIFKGNDRFLYSVPSTGNIFMGTNSGNFTMWIGGTGNIGIGNEALNSLSATPSAAPNSKDDNVAIGHTALKLNTTGYYNVGVGSRALWRNTTGHNNVAMGDDALSLNTTGYDNVAIGSQAGVYNINSSGDYGNIMIGARAAVAPGNVNSIAIGTGAFASSTNEVRIGNSNTTFNFLYGNVWAINGSFDTYSDSRLKHDVYSLGDADYRKILALRPVSFSWNSNNSKGIGFIAQEVEKLYPEVISVDPGTGMKGISYAELISPTIAALQAQQKKIDEQDTLIRILLDRVNRLEKDIKR